MKKTACLLLLPAFFLLSCQSSASSVSLNPSITPVSSEASSSSISSLASESSSSESTVTYASHPYENPIHFYRQDGTEYFVAAADPDCIYGDDGYYYLYITNATVEMGSKGLLFDRGPIFRSKTLTSWTWCGSVFDGHPDAGLWGTKDAGVWAPSVIQVGDHYNYYYSLSTWGDANPGVGVATSPTPYGPWTHYGKVLDQNMTGVRNGIDPYVCYEDNDLYILWGSFYGIAATKLTDDGTELFYGDQVKDHLTWVIPNNRADTESADVNLNYEGSYVVKKDGEYFYFGSQGTCLSGTASTYTVKTGKSASLFGPYLGSDGNDMVNGTYGDIVVAPSEDVGGTGHNTVIQDEKGDYWLIYHGYDIKASEHSDERQLFLDKLIWDDTTHLPHVKDRKASVHTVLDGPVTIA
jgi:arabinan endo-1,5-alpha-L-arabinosidase